MERSVVRIIILLPVLIVQTSFFSALFAEGTVPIFPLVVVVAWTLLLGFMESWKWTVITGIACDAVFALPMGTMVAVLTVSCYGISFFSARFLTTHRVWGGALLSLLVALTTAFAAQGAAVATIVTATGNLSPGELLLSPSPLLWQILFTVTLFWTTYPLLRKVEHQLSFYKRKIDIKRHG